MSQHDPQSQPCRLLRLPADVRLRIYYFLGIYNPDTEVTPVSLEPHRHMSCDPFWGTMVERRSCGFDVHPEILRTCRSLHQDGSPLLYSGTFKIVLDTFNTSCGTTIHTGALWKDRTPGLFNVYDSPRYRMYLDTIIKFRRFHFEIVNYHKCNGWSCGSLDDWCRLSGLSHCLKSLRRAKNIDLITVTWLPSPNQGILHRLSSKSEEPMVIRLYRLVSAFKGIRCAGFSIEDYPEGLPCTTLDSLRETVLSKRPAVDLDRLLEDFRDYYWTYQNEWWFFPVKFGLKEKPCCTPWLSGRRHGYSYPCSECKFERLHSQSMHDKDPQIHRRLHPSNPVSWARMHNAMQLWDTYAVANYSCQLVDDIIVNLRNIANKYHDAIVKDSALEEYLDDAISQGEAVKRRIEATCALSPEESPVPLFNDDMPRYMYFGYGQ